MPIPLAPNVLTRAFAVTHFVQHPNSGASISLIEYLSIRPSTLLGVWSESLSRWLALQDQELLSRLDSRKQGDLTLYKLSCMSVASVPSHIESAQITALLAKAGITGPLHAEHRLAQLVDVGVEMGPADELWQRVIAAYRRITPTDPLDRERIQLELAGLTRMPEVRSHVEDGIALSELLSVPSCTEQLRRARPTR